MNVCESPTASDGAVHITVPPAKVQPALADVKVSPAGSGSETLTSSAWSGPALDAFSVNVSLVPGTPGTGETDLFNDRSAVGTSVITGSAVLLARLGSWVWLVTDVGAASCAGPLPPILTTTENDVEPPAANDAAVQVTVSPETVHPGPAETNVAPGGSLNDTTTLVAELGPALPTTSS